MYFLLQPKKSSVGGTSTNVGNADASFPSFAVGSSPHISPLASPPLPSFVSLKTSNNLKGSIPHLELINERQQLSNCSDAAKLTSEYDSKMHSGTSVKTTKFTLPSLIPTNVARSSNILNNTLDCLSVKSSHLLFNSRISSSYTEPSAGAIQNSEQGLSVANQSSKSMSAITSSHSPSANEISSIVSPVTHIINKLQLDIFPKTSNANEKALSQKKVITSRISPNDVVNIR